MEEARKELLEDVDEINKMFIQFIGAYKLNKGSLNIFQFEGFIPQIIDEETDMVK